MTPCEQSPLQPSTHTRLLDNKWRAHQTKNWKEKKRKQRAALSLTIKKTVLILASEHKYPQNNVKYVKRKFHCKHSPYKCRETSSTQPEPSQWQHTGQLWNHSCNNSIRLDRLSTHSYLVTVGTPNALGMRLNRGRKISKTEECASELLTHDFCCMMTIACYDGSG